MLTNPDGAVLSANMRMCEMLGMTEEEILAAGRADVVVHDERLLAAHRGADKNRKVPR